jgi:hypothetical protein
MVVVVGAGLRVIEMVACGVVGGDGLPPHAARREIAAPRMNV